MVRTALWGILLVLGAVLASCGGSAGGVPTLSLESTQFEVVPWKADGSHQVTVKGVVLLDKKPLSGARVKVGERVSDALPDGAFTVLVDRSFPHRVPVHVLAPVDGAVTTLQVSFPVRVVRATAVGSDVEVEAHVGGMDQTDPFRVDLWVLDGVVRSADGRPVEGAVVSISEWNSSALPGAHVENFRGAPPSDVQGRFRMYYSADDDLQVTLRVVKGDTSYTLPEGRVYELPSETSSHLEITLPRTGTTIVDRPPTLVGHTEEGARWKALVVSVADGESRYPSTAIGADGTVLVRLPKAAWDQGVSWFEQYYLIDQKAPMKAGQWLPVGPEAVSEGERLVLP